MIHLSRRDAVPRLPLEGAIDLTYRCNNACRHCWLWEADSPETMERELTFDEIRTIVDEARSLGCRHWDISGGEPLLRADFSEVFDYVTSRATGYTLNTNGTLITPEIARLLRRRGTKMVALYGATADVYDDVTRHPGGFELLMEGFARLREAGAGFIVQVVPMRANWHQFARMQELARSQSRYHRIGAPWLFKSACGDPGRNAEIERQRLDPADVVALDPPDAHDDERDAPATSADDRLYAACIESRRDFHVDPYGGMSFCGFVKDPALRYDLRSAGAAAGERGRAAGAVRGVAPGAVRAAWEEFIPSLGEVRGGTEYLDGCGSCASRADCKWCDVYGYLEHGRHGAKVGHLCAVARESRAARERWTRDHRRYYQIGGITVRVDSDLAFDEATFERKFAAFRVDGPGADAVVLRHHFGIPEMDDARRGEEVYRRAPWAISRRGSSWVYEGISSDANDPTLHCLAVFSADHARAEIYNADEAATAWRAGGLGSLTLFPSDQILLARLLADREGCLLHSGALLIDGQGLLFVGHSDAGKSTVMGLVRRELGERAEILCDDRNVVRRWPDGFRVHGTWCHGDVPDVSPAAAPLRAILFLEQAERNEIETVSDHKLVWRHLLATLIRPMVTVDWWQKEMDVLERIVNEVPCAVMRFDRSGAIVPGLERLTR